MRFDQLNNSESAVIDRSIPRYRLPWRAKALFTLSIVALFNVGFAFAAVLQEPTKLSGLAHERDLNYIEAIAQYKLEIETLEASKGEYAFELVEPLKGLARSYESLTDFEQAAETARRAQHISHRHEGVHTKAQLEIIEMMTRMHLYENEPLMADSQQKFAYYIRQADLPKDSLASLAASDLLSTWYEQTGQLQRARKLNEKSLEIIETQQGENSLLKLPYLNRLAKIKRLQRACCSTRVMNEALDIIEANPDADSSMKADVYLKLADAHTVSGNTKDAKHFYEQAWLNMPQGQRTELFSSPSKIALSRPLNDKIASNVRMFRTDRDPFGRQDFKKLSEREVQQLDSLPPQEFFLSETGENYGIKIRDRSLNQGFDEEKVARTIGEPFSFLREQFIRTLPNRYRKDDELNRMVVELEFNVDASGRTKNVRVISQAVPPKVSQLMREVIRKTRFRPRLKDGIALATNQHRITQTFSTRFTIPESL